MTIAILEYDADGGKPERFKVRGGQCVLIGSSNSADIRLANPDRVAAQHCEVTFASGTLSVKNLTEGGQIRVNGDVVKRQRLNHGDLLEIGSNRLKVVMQAEPKTNSDAATSSSAGPAVAVAAAATAAGAITAVHAGANSHATTSETPPSDTSTDEPVPKLGEGDSDSAEEEAESLPRLEIPKNGLRVGLVEKFDADLLPLIGGEATKSQMSLLLNHRISGLEVEPPEQTNLLADLPSDLAETNDLYLCPISEVADLVKTFDRYAEKNAASLLIKRTGDPVSEDDLRMLAAWFLTPGNAKFNFINGTNLLLERVFSVVDAIVVRDTEKKMDMLMLFDGTVTDWPSLVDWLKEGNDDADH